MHDEDASIDRYKLLRQDRNTRGGGVCLYVHNKLQFEIIESNNLVEQLFVSVKLGSVRLAFGVVYNPSWSSLCWLVLLLQISYIVLGILT